MSTFCLPESLKVVKALAAQVGANDVKTGDWLKVSDFHKVYILITYDAGGANNETFQPLKGTADATGSTNITTAVRIWSNEATGTNDRWVERTAATSWLTTGAAGNIGIIFEIDPATLGDTYDWISFNTTAIAAGDYVAAWYLCVPRYPQRASTSPTALT